MSASSRESYHHGGLRAALIRAADDIIRDNGIEGFSLREAARRAGVSPGAPAHHFGGVAGLLTRVAVLAYEELGTRLRGVELVGLPARDIQALTEAYVGFALDQPGRFRLICRKDLVDRDDPTFKDATMRAMFGFAKVAAAYYETDLPGNDGVEVHPGILATFASAHGIAHMAIEDKWTFALRGDDPRRDFMERLLPAMLKAQWPDRTG